MFRSPVRIAAATTVLSLAACMQPAVTDQAVEPAVSTRQTYSYVNDIRPILDEACMRCHEVGGEGHQESGLSMESYDDLMKGTKFGPMIVPGDSLTSNLVILIEGKSDPSIYMPKGDHGPLTEKQIGLIKKWIEQGAKNN